MARGNGRLQSVISQFPEHLQAGDGMRQQSRLGEPRLVKLLPRVFERDINDIVTEDLASLLINAFGRWLGLEEIASHACVLGALSWKDKKDVLFPGEHSTDTWIMGGSVG